MVTQGLISHNCTTHEETQTTTTAASERRNVIWKVLSYLSEVWVLRGVTEVSKHPYSLQILFNVLYSVLLAT